MTPTMRSSVGTSISVHGGRWAVPKVVIAMPAYKSEGTLERTVADIPSGLADQLILVDDASPDNTAALAESLGIQVHVHPENRGYGGNQKTCYRTALADGADIIVLLHPDYQYDPKAVRLLIAPILAGDADMTFGSRFAGLGNPRAGGMPLYRYVGNRATTILENLILGARFTEMHSGLRAFTRSCLLSIPWLNYTDDFAFDSQFMVDAITLGQRVVEVPIPTRYTEESSSIAVGRSLKYIGHSIGYAALKAVQRGRRRRRVQRSRDRMGTAADYAGKQKEFEHPAAAYSWLLDHISGYVLRGDALLELGEGTGRFLAAAAQRGYKARDLKWDDEPARSADVIVWLGSPRLTSEALGAARRIVDNEGLLVLSGEVGERLSAPSWRVIERARFPRLLVRARPPSLVIARPTA